MSFFESLKPASFRGVPFGVLNNEGQYGRRIAEHLYPMRDTQWMEDLGRAPRRYTVSGFLVSDSRVYGGGDVRDQAERMIAAAEAAGEGTLVHPTLGELQVSCQALQTTERWDAGLCIDLQFTFLEAGKRIFPQAVSSTGDAVGAAGAGAADAARSDFDAAVASLIAT